MKWLLHLKKPNQQTHFCLHGMGAFSCGVPISVWVLINTMPIFMGCLFCVGAYYSDFTVCSKWTVPTDNMRPKLHDNYSCHL